MSKDDRGARSLWAAFAAPAAGQDALQGRVRTDVAVIGGGLHGMSTALHLAESGVSVTVLDASDVSGDGVASVASGGLVAPQLIRGTPHSIRDEYADGVGQKFVELMAGAGRYTFDLIARHGLACDASSDGFLAPFFASQRSQSEKVAREWEGFRSDVSIVDEATVARLTGCAGYSGALLDRSGGAVDPLSYAREMGRRAVELGAILFRNTRVLAIEHGAQGSVLRTAQGSVLAGKIVLAANGGNVHLHPALARTILPLDVGEVATAPLPAHLRSAILPAGHAMTDRGPDIFTIRYDAAGRLITSMTMPWARSASRVAAAVNARLRRRIPGWQDMPLDFLWSGRAWLNTDFTPRFVRLENNMLAIQACNGRGVALAGPIGREVAAWVTEADWRPGLPVVPPKPINGYVLTRHLPNLALGLAAIKGRLAA